MPTELDRLVDLRLRIAPREPRDRRAARAYFARVYEPILASARSVATLARGESLRAVVLCSEPIPARFGVPESSVLIFVEREDSEARCWADAALQRLGPELPEHCTLELNPSDHALLETVRKLGFGCAKVDLGGSVSLALSRLRGKTVRPEEHGVAFAEPELAQAPAIAELVRDFFLGNPELGWGGPLPAAQEQALIDRREQERIEGRLREGPASDFIVCRQGQLLGAFWFVQHSQHPVMGSCAGLNIILLPEVQGLGLGRAAYLHMLEAMDRLGVERIFGRTSNPGVIHIGQSIGRPLRRLVLRRDGPFISPDRIASLLAAVAPSPP